MACASQIALETHILKTYFKLENCTPAEQTDKYLHRKRHFMSIFRKLFLYIAQFKFNSCIENMSDNSWACTEEINIFREYLRIPSVQPNVNYSITTFPN